MRKIKVLEMIDKSSLGGGQIHLLTLCRGLDKTRIEASVCARGGGPLEEEIRREGIRFLPVSFGKKTGWKSAGEIARVLAIEKFDIVHTHGGVAGFFGRRAAGKAGTPVIIHTLHGIHYLHYRNPMLKYLHILLERHFSRKTDAVVFVSDADFAAGRRFRLSAGAKMRLIKNGIEVPPPPTADSKRAQEEWRTKLGLVPPVVGTVARLHRQKGVEYMLRAAPEILRHRPEAKIVIIGGGPLEKALRLKAAEMGLDRRVQLLGERTDARTILDLFDVFVLPSLWEGLSLALLEAAARGKPIIATDIDGTREVIRNGETGILVPPKDPAKLSEAVLRVLGDPGLAAKIGESARREIPALFSLPEMIAKTERMYLELAALKITPG
jgi:glycosyltransferase involved in cell wall biosynthesis